MLPQLLTSGLLAAVSLFAPSVEAKKMTAVRFETRAENYLWTVQWTGPTKCTSWPCGYSYRVTGPTYTAAEGSVPFFNATCVGTVDKPLQACTLQPGSAAAAVSGNFSTYETSGVGSGLIDVSATWIDATTGSNRTLTAVTPMQASAANQNTWTVQPEGCPVTAACDAAKATRSLRRGTIGIKI